MNSYPEFTELINGYLQERDRSLSWLARRLGINHNVIDSSTLINNSGLTGAGPRRLQLQTASRTRPKTIGSSDRRSPAVERHFAGGQARHKATHGVADHEQRRLPQRRRRGRQVIARAREAQERDPRLFEHRRCLAAGIDQVQ